MACLYMQDVSLDSVDNESQEVYDRKSEILQWDEVSVYLTWQTTQFRQGSPTDNNAYCKTLISLVGFFSFLNLCYILRNHLIS